MKRLLLTKIRLSWYFAFFVICYFLILSFLPSFTFDSPALTLFSVNSFLYGFYIAPVLAGQKARIDELHQVVRAEANAIFSMVLFTKTLSRSLRTKVQSRFDEYVKDCSTNKLKAAEKSYENLITFCVEYKGEEKDKITALLTQIVSNQQNRTNFYLQMGNKVYSNEWMIMTVLFSITLIFILLIDTGGNVGIRLVTALLCTGISMLMINLVKLNSLTHKKAKQIWTPFITLRETHYYRIDEQNDNQLNLS